MKKIYLFSLILLGISIHAQNTPKITFEFDNAGNQIKRILCSDCSARTSGDLVKNFEEITEKDLLKFYPEDVISYYPNPVKEQLYLQWEINNDNKVSSIEVYALNGQLLKSFKNLQTKNNFVISFNDLPRNVYSINLVYTNGEHKPIKIIKK